MPVGVVFIGLFGLLWIWALVRLFEARTLPRIFAVLMSGILLYLSFELTMWSIQTPLMRMFFIGILPLIGVIIGFAIYDRHQKLEQRKPKQEKQKRSTTVTEEPV